MKAGNFRSQRKHLSNIIPPSPVSATRTRASLRHSTTLKLRPKIVHFDGSIEIDDSPFSSNPNPVAYTLEKIPHLSSNSTSQRYSNSITSRKDVGALSSEVPKTRLPRKEKSAEARVSVNELLDRCRDFQADKSLSK